ncbi:MAG TPA: hypothetical protein VNL73_08510 [Verrucomicrobiae bacterium]|nr:hypothetical protein [Verrucomicrobiae bacterium]
MKRHLFAALTVFSLAGLAVIGLTADKNPHGKIQWACEDCHTAKSWSKLRSPLKFAHNETGFALVGAHKAAACIGCHKTPVFSRVAVACADCHTDVHKGQMGIACQNCHTTENWQNRQDILTLHAQKGFPLTGVHATADCEACHRGQAREEFANTAADCYSCHQSQFISAKNPDHVQGGFSHDCSSCHTSSFWVPANFDHARTRFALTGAHRTVACASCHVTGYAGTAADCYSCHQNNFAAAQSPNHVQNNFNHDCTQCHTTTAWTPARFDHSQTRFPLTGAHLRTACVACHATGYTGLPLNCYGCHQGDYAATTNPNHSAAGFSTDCQTCHTTSAWVPSSWNHDAQYFPIYSGSHKGRWTTCADCHVVPSNFAVFECINCHAHDKATMDAKHAGRQGYQYASTACYNCHPRGTH